MNRQIVSAAILPLLLASSGCVVVPSSPDTPSAGGANSVSAAESACLAAVANEVNEGDVSTINSRQGENSTVVLVRVPGAQAPWQCEYGYRGGSSAVLRVFYTGSEGAL